MSLAPGEGFKDKTKEDISKQKFLSIAVDDKSGLCLRLSRPLLYRYPCRRACHGMWWGLEGKPVSLAESSQAPMCQGSLPPQTPGILDSASSWSDTGHSILILTPVTLLFHFTRACLKLPERVASGMWVEMQAVRRQLRALWKSPCSLLLVGKGKRNIVPSRELSPKQMER